MANGTLNANRLGGLLLVSSFAAACQVGHGEDLDTGAHTSDASGEPAVPSFCARDDADAVRDVFCTDEPPAIESLSDLQHLLNVYPHAPNESAPYVGDAMDDNPYAAGSVVAVMSHSTSLSGRLVSPINPRILILGEHTIMAYTRGVQRVELASLSRVTNDHNFYLLAFEQACNATEQGCGPGDLYTPRIEGDWTNVSIEDGEALKNTALDCQACHQRGLEKPVLLMRELEAPWTHFFLPVDVGSTYPGASGSDLMQDYLAAKADEVYGGYDLSTIAAVMPVILQRRVGGKQPLNFDSLQILTERYPEARDGYAREPQPSPTWERAYEAFKRGEQLAVPYLDQRATDPDKQRRLTDAYRRYRDGELAAEDLPDLADIYPDDATLRARMGLQTAPLESPQDALIQACGSCHNDVLDQSLSRAKFNIAVSRLDQAERELAIERIQRHRSAPGVMPPPEARQLDPEVIPRLIEYLREASEPDPRLERAAQMGMMGGGISTEVLF